MANLSPNQLLKYDWRVSTFLDKYKSGDHFELVDGRKVQIIFDESAYHAIESKDVSRLLKLRLTDGRNIYSLSSFKKTYEFGGKPDGTHAGAKTEEYEINSINQQLNVIKDGRCSIPIHIRDGTISVARCIKTNGTPKSDFTLLDENDYEVGWISHKKGSTCKDFQNWSGMTQPAIRDHIETQEFISQIRNLYQDEMPKATTVAKPIKSLDLQNLAVYGINYINSTLSSQNVTMVLQGPITILPFGDIWQFNANHVHYNGDTLQGDYEPVFMAIYKGDRNNFNIKGARFSIQSKGCRNVKMWL